MPMLMMVRLNQRSSPPSSWIRYCVGAGAFDCNGEPGLGEAAAVDDVDVDGGVESAGDEDDDDDERDCWKEEVMVGGADPTGKVLLLTMRPCKNKNKKVVLYFDSLWLVTHM